MRTRAGRGADIDTAVKHLLTHRGMSYRETRGLSGEALKSMVFDGPSCAHRFWSLRRHEGSTAVLSLIVWGRQTTSTFLRT